MDYISIGASPADEDCVEVGSPDYERKSRIECAAFREAIRKKLGPEPIGAQLRLKSLPHDFGTYLEVVCYHDESDAAISYALKCESEAPTTWAEVEMENPLVDFKDVVPKGMGY